MHEKVLDLARDISRLGFFPSEPPVAIRDGANTIVVEGNRRLAALKLLLNPELAPVEFQKRFQQIVDSSNRRVEKVPVVLAPSRTAAVPLIVSRHKGDSIKAWTTVMQARFVQSRFDDGLSIDDIAAETGLERKDVIKTLRDAKHYDVILSNTASGCTADRERPQGL
jgi:hypothetical protein